MNSKVKIIKSGTRTSSNGLASTTGKTKSEGKREPADTVKSWINEWEERKRLLKESAFALITCLDRRS